MDQRTAHVQKDDATLYIAHWRIVDCNAFEAGMALMLKAECPGLNLLMETLEEVNNGKTALLDGEPTDSVCQMMVVRVPCRLPGHGMEDVGAWNISSTRETTEIYSMLRHICWQMMVSLFLLG